MDEETTGQDPVWEAHLKLLDEATQADIRMRMMMQELHEEGARRERKRNRARQAKALGYSPAIRA